PFRRVDHAGAGVDIDLGHHLGDQRDQGLGPSGAADSEEFAGRGVHHLRHLTHRPTAGVEDTEPHQLVVMELVRVLGGRQAGGVHQEEHAAQSVGGVPAVHAGQTHEKPPGMVPGGFHDDLAVGGVRPASCSSDQAGAGGEALLGGVGPDLDDEFAADAVRLGDAPDDEFHRKSCARQRSVSTTSTRTSGPATDVTIVRMADAVRPPPALPDSDSAAASAALAASSSAFLAASASSAFLACSALRLEVIASAEGSPWASSSALLARSSLEGWGSATFSEPTAPSM